jgi:hypothetical protein
VQIYPNPVSNDQFTIQFGKIATGAYNIELTDVMGRMIQQQSVNVMTEDQVQHIKLKPSIARGIYLVNIIGQDKISVYNQKIVVQ